MKAVKVLIVALTVFSIATCQKVKEPETAKLPQATKEVVKKQTVVQKPEIPTQEDGPIEVVNSPLTEEEQREFDKIGGGLGNPKALKNEKEAINYLKILLKGGPKTIRWYQEAIKENQYTQRAAKGWYEGDIEFAISKIDPRNKEGSDIIIEVLKTKNEYPRAIAKATKALQFSPDSSVLPMLRDLAKHPVPYVRFEAAGSLLSLGEADAALPVLEELAEKEGYSAALYYLFRGKGKIIDERGYRIVEKALNYQNADVRISAAKLLFDSKRLNRARMEEIALEALNTFKSPKEYGIIFDDRHGIIPTPGSEETFEKSEQRRGSDWGVVSTAISILIELRSKKAIPALEKLANNPDASYLRNEAKRAIDILKTGGEI